LLDQSGEPAHLVEQQVGCFAGDNGQGQSPDQQPPPQATGAQIEPPDRQPDAEEGQVGDRWIEAGEQQLNKQPTGSWTRVPNVGSSPLA
jgi:hypothetical protein